MTVQDLGAIGELISAIAVVVTLVYLAIQVKAAKDHAITSTNFQSAQALRDELTVFMEPALLRSALVKAFEAPSDLSADEEMVMDAWLQLTMHMREAEYYEAKRGTFPAERWEASKQIIRMNLAAKWSREWWEGPGKKTKSNEFVRLVDGIVASTPLMDRYVLKADA